jgi:hypothetical protein
MKNSKTPKIVVGVALAAVYATVLAAFMPRGANDNVVAENASAVTSTQIALEPAASTAIVPASADALTSVAEQPAATTAATTSVADIPAKTRNAAAPPSRESQAKSQGTEQPMASVPIASSNNEVEVEEPIQASEGNSAGRGSLITPESTSPMAAAAVDGNVEVTTNGAADEPTGSASTQEE